MEKKKSGFTNTPWRKRRVEHLPHNLRGMLEMGKSKMDGLIDTTKLEKYNVWC